MLNEREEAEILRMYGAGKTEKFIADITTNPLSLVVEVINRRAAGDRAIAKQEAQKFTPTAPIRPAAPRPQPKPAAEPSVVETSGGDFYTRFDGPVEVQHSDGKIVAGPFLLTLIALAAESGKASTRALGMRLDGMAKQLQEVLEAEAAAARVRAEQQRARAEAHERLRAAEQALADARAGIRELSKKAAAAATATVDAARPAPMSEPALIRAWAAANGLTCPKHGPIPKGVAAAYETAHQSKQATAAPTAQAHRRGTR